jgi:hypothetical protein
LDKYLNYNWQQPNSTVTQQNKKTPQNDPLEFYKAKKEEFPNVARIARHLLCIPATSVSAESLFSRAGMIQNDQRSRLHPMRLQQFCFLNHNQSLLS